MANSNAWHASCNSLRKDATASALFHAVTTMHIRTIGLLFLLCCCLPGLTVAATTQSIHVEWGYTPPSEPAVTGFRLYQEGVVPYVCQVQDPTATAMDCQVSLPQGTANFTLTATFSDGTESPHSTPFPFTASSDAAAPGAVPENTGTTGSKLFTFNWTPATDATAISGYRLYLNNTLLCETTTPSATSIACRADLLHQVMTFSMTEVTTNGSETNPSNLLVFDPTAYPELFNTKQLGFTWEYDQATDIAGFRVYQNAVLICQTSDPAARQLTCTADLTATPVTYTLTAVNADGTETSLSNALTYTGSGTTGTDEGELRAVIAANTASGPAPLPVTFNGAASTGGVTGYRWDFGDGSTATGSTASHTYATAGTYTAQLTVVDDSGTTNTATVAIVASSSDATTASTPPTAVISSSTATGPAPLTVSLDGSGSTATNATITSYNWSFGDGSSATGATASHAYTSAGTYTATLTVIDSKGQSSQIGTPVIVTGSATANKPPQAAIGATPLAGSAPLTVTFDGGGSSDSDGSISSYVWNFGDGSTATGKSVTHTYTTAATFTATLNVTDNQGASGSASIAISTNTEQPAAEVRIETGEVGVSSEWVRVPLTTSFTNPIVIAGPPSFKNGEPCVIRLRNVNKTGFDIKLTEWNYLDGTHPQESISYLVMEKGHYTLPNGATVEAGSFAGTTSFKTVSFGGAFPGNPVVFTTVASVNEADTIGGRIKNVGSSGFSYYFREQEKNTNTHLNETVNYIAWEPGKGTIGTLQYEVAKTANAVTDAWYSGQHQGAFSQPPLLLADMQTTNNTDTSALRMQNQTATGFQVKVEEEQSKDSEVTHPAETVGYIALDQPPEKALATFSWEFDATLEATISGFQILANGETICTTGNPSARQLSCEITVSGGPMAFTVQTMETAGGNSSPSNSITYTP